MTSRPDGWLGNSKEVAFYDPNPPVFNKKATQVFGDYTKLPESERSDHVMRFVSYGLQLAGIIDS